MKLKINDLVQYNGRTARIITLPLKQDRGGHATIIFDSTQRALTVPVTELVVQPTKETGRPTSTPVSN